MYHWVHKTHWINWIKDGVVLLCPMFLSYSVHICDENKRNIIITEVVF